MCPPTSITASPYALGRRRDLADDLDDVAVRVEHAQLRVGARAAAEDLLYPAELAVGAELARMRLDQLQRSPDRLRDGHAVPPPGVQVHHRCVEPVAGDRKSVV